MRFVACSQPEDIVPRNLRLHTHVLPQLDPDLQNFAVTLQVHLKYFISITTGGEPCDRTLRGQRFRPQPLLTCSQNPSPAAGGFGVIWNHDSAP